MKEGQLCESVWVKQAVVRQGMQREPENSHLGRPDHIHAPWASGPHWLLWQLLVLGPQREAVSKEDGWQAEATKLEVVLTGDGKIHFDGPPNPSATTCKCVSVLSL